MENTSRPDYDVIIVGGGSAGCVLASRLSEDAGRTVLLLEAGPAYAPNHYPADLTTLGRFSAEPQYTWGYQSTGLKPAHSLAAYAGKLLGGTSAINGGISRRALPSDFARWQKHGLPAWGWDQALTTYKQLERFEGGSDKYHGRSGPWFIRQGPLEEVSPAVRAFADTAAANGFARIDDFNGERQEGVGTEIKNSSNGVRLNAGMAYLSREVRARPNLTSSRTCSELFAAVAQQSASVIPWHFFAVSRLSDPQELFYIRTDAQGHSLPPQDREALRDAASLDEASLRELLQAVLPLYAAPGVYAGPACAAVVTRYPLVRLWQRLFRLEALLCLPVPLPGGDAALFTLGSRHPYGFDEAALALLERLRPQIVLALQNQAAFTRIVAQQQLEREKTYLVEEIKTSQNFEEIVGSASTLREVFQSIDQVAATTTTVLILGETGTGKELIARAIHHRSPRRQRVLVKVNCAALPPQLIESELFGHEKGAFTGAIEQRIGKFELADGGTIFLDEIGELPLELQAKLLRVLQEREIERLGGKRVLPLDVRVVAATNRVLVEEVAAGRFRADLYYRLNVFPIILPPLRERRADIPLLVEYFGRKFSRRLGRPYLGLQPGCLEQLVTYSWPGNVRELENVVEHAVIVSQGQPLTCGAPPNQLAVAAVPAASEAQTERTRIETALQQARWRIRGASGAAALLGLKPTTLEACMKRLGIK